MPRYALQISYDGTNYHGWQVQPNAITVQEVLEKKLGQFLGDKPVKIVGCGRTDTGVHARHFLCHFDWENDIPNDTWFRLNVMLPKDIAVQGQWKMDEEWSSRFSALERCYHYHVHLLKNPFQENYSTRVQPDLDFHKMNEAALLLLKYDEFTSFARQHADTLNDFCDVRKAEWIQKGPTEWYFEIRANRFLRNMVRAIVGTLLEVGQGKISKQEFEEIIKSKNRSNAGTSAPAHGLYLQEIIYDKNDFLGRE